MKSLEVFYASLREQLSETVYAMQDAGDTALFIEIDAAISRLHTTQLLPVSDQLYLRNSPFSSFRKLDILQGLLDQKDTTEIMVNSKDQVFVEWHGKVERYDLHLPNEEQLEDMIQRIMSCVNRNVNVSTPIVDTRLPDGSRVHIVLSPISLDGPIITTRKSPESIAMEALIDFGTLTAEAAAFLKKAIAAGHNIFISGSTNSGKTTFLNALPAFISKTRRVVTIKDSAGFRLLHIENLIRLETRNRNVEGEGQIRIADLIRAGFRMNPDHIIVGEVHGARALDMLQAVSTGHDGSLSTSHTDSAADILARLETTTLGGANLPLAAIQQQTAGALDLTVHLGRLRDRSRRVLSITEIGGVSHGEVALHDLFTSQEEKEQDGFRVRGELRTIGTLRRRGELDAAGLAL